MKLHVKVPPPPRLPQGLITLVQASRSPHAATSPTAEPRVIMEPHEATRAWKPDRTLLQREPQPASASDFACAANEQTMVGATNLNDPCLFRSEHPPAPMQNAPAECVEDEEATIEFVGSLTDLNRDDAEPRVMSVWGEE